MKALREKIRNMISKKTVIITGVQGQDGSYAAEHYLNAGYQVYGVARRKSSGETNLNIKHINDKNFIFAYGDISDSAFISDLIDQIHPEIYINLAAMSHVGQSFKEPLETFKVDALSVVMVLDIIRRQSPKTKFYQAGTSELWGSSVCPPDGFDEASPFHPRSPYGVAKAAAFYATQNAREAYGLFATNGILCNHSSPRRSLDFATRKITRGVAKIKLGQASELRMGNLDAYRDEGHSKDFVKAISLILNQPKPDDYVVSIGYGATIREMLQFVAELAELDSEKIYVADPQFMRPSDVPYLKGNSSKIRELGWKPEYDWKSLLTEMYQHDLSDLSK